MFGRVVLLVAIAGCVSARPWQPKYTASTVFEGERVELVSGNRVNVSCSEGEDHDYPLWGGCFTHKATSESETYVRWGAREFTLTVTGHIDYWTPVPRLEGLRIRRLSKQVIVFEVRADDARWRDDVFVCLQKPGGCIWGKTPLARAASLEVAHGQAMARGWDARDLDAFFGESSRHHVHAIGRYEWGYLESRWPDLAPEMRQLALSAAIAKHDESFIRSHWDDLDARNVRRAIELFVEHDRYAFLARDPWWSKLSSATQQLLVELAIDGVPSLEREQFLNDRIRETGDERLREALRRRRY